MLRVSFLSFPFLLVPNQGYVSRGCGVVGYGGRTEKDSKTRLDNKINK